MIHGIRRCGTCQHFTKGVQGALAEWCNVRVPQWITDWLTAGEAAGAIGRMRAVSNDDGQRCETWRPRQQ